MQLSACSSGVAAGYFQPARAVRNGLTKTRNIGPHHAIFRTAAVQEIVKRRNLGGCCRSEGINDPHPFPLIAYKPGMSQRGQVARDRRLRNPEHGLQIAHADIAEPKKVQEP
jgi:hypothetical protein